MLVGFRELEVPATWDALRKEVRRGGLVTVVLGAATYASFPRRAVFKAERLQDWLFGYVGWKGSWIMRLRWLIAILRPLLAACVQAKVASLISGC